MKITHVANIYGGQDGAVYGSHLFRMDTKGVCRVYDLSALNTATEEENEPIAQFVLDRAEEIVPHSNAVCFGCDFFEEGDEYPLLYSNIYNNYADHEDPMLGVCLVYRLQRNGNAFYTTLVQMIRVGFCENAELWKASPEAHGVRPFGNFVIDRDTRSYWAFVMRNETLGTRYFRFRLPTVHEGETDARLGIKCVLLSESDIQESFDCSYHRFIQGAILYKGRIYSTEGFHADAVNRPAIRVINLATREELYVDIMKMGFLEEPEFIDFYHGECFYGDANGNLYRLEL